MKIILTIFIAIIVSGCASVKPIKLSPDNSIYKYENKKIVVTKRALPNFQIMTAGKVAGGSLFGALGGATAGASMLSEGQKYLVSNSIEDPSLEVAKKNLQVQI